MNKLDKDKNLMISSLDDIILLSDFINYNSLGKNPKKVKKELKKLRRLLKHNKFDKCMRKEWLDKHEF